MRDDAHSEADAAAWELLFDRAPAAMVLLTADGTITHANEAARRLLGVQPSQPLAAAFRGDAETVTAWLAEVAVAPSDHSVFAEGDVRPDERERHVELFGRNMLADPNVESIVVHAVDVTARWEQSRDLGDLAFRDALTGLANRRLFLDRLGQARRAAAKTGRPLQVILIDLDGFKRINDTYGHPTGDDLLCVVAQRLAGQLREDATLARIGGDEMIVLLPEASDAEAVALAQRLRDAIRAPINVESTVVTISGCFGVASNVDAFSTETIMRNADVAMYQGKSRGRDQIVVYQPGLVLAERERLVQVEHLDELRRANEALERQTRIDELTGVPNLRAYRERLGVIDAEARRRGSAYSVLFCDIDLFGPYNKRKGEQAGDAALQAVAGAISGSCRRGDEMFRRGGEELVVVLPDTDDEGAAAMAERVRGAVEDLQLPHRAAAGMDVVTISVGVSTLDPERHPHPADVEAEADHAMVRAKQAGRNRWIAGSG